MSANNQTLIVSHEDNYYVFENIMAESWCDEEDTNRVNELKLSSAIAILKNLESAYKKAQEIDDKDATEYGVHVNQLAKDGSELKLI